MRAARSRESCAPGSGAVLDRLGTSSPKIAVLRASRVGDFICALPALSDLRRARPEAELVLVGLPLMADLASRAEPLDRFVAFPGFPGIADQFFEPKTVVSFLAAMQDEKFDLVLQMHGSGTYANPFALLMGGRFTAGFTAPDGYRALLDATLPFDESQAEVARCRALVSLIGAPPAEFQGGLKLLQADRTSALSLLAGNSGPWIGVHAGARDRFKRWPLDRYLSLAERLSARTGGTVFLIGSTEDEGGARRMSRRTGPSHAHRTWRVVDLRERTTLPVLAAVIAELDLFVGNDSGPAHLAYLADTPSLTLFGGTDPARWGPDAWSAADLGRHRTRHHTVVGPAACRPCDPGPCKRKRSCLDAVSVEQVEQAALALLDPA